MTTIHQLQTERLLLRQWRDSDLAPFAAANADPEVMEYFPSTMTLKESAAKLNDYRDRIAGRGWGFWAVEKIDEAAFIGVVGLNPVEDLPIGESVEVGWRLASDYWGQGLAAEAARASLQFAFSTLGLDQVVAVTSVGNRRSRELMVRLGMRDAGENFLHPRVPADSSLAEHVLYRIDRETFAALVGA